MTAENKISGITSWTPEQEPKIAEYQEKGGMSRGEAVRKLRKKRTELKPKTEPKPKAPKVKKEKVVKISIRVP